MSNLSLDFDNLGSIRKTEDGKISVYDLISVVGDQKSPREVWNRLTEQFPEVVAKCDNLKFKGAGQRNTPVTDKEGALYIIGLLPGAIGKKYRAEAAKLVLQYLEDPEALAKSAIDRIEDPEALERVKERAEGKQVRLGFTQTLKDRGVTGIGYATNTNAIYKGTLGTTAGHLKDTLQVTNPRDGLSTTELMAIKFAEHLAQEKMKEVNARGNKETTACSKLAADTVGEALNTFRTSTIPVFDFTKE
jgi:hypothetical protein